MKYYGSIDIKQPIKKVTELFADPKNLKEYQEDFIRKELVSGKKEMMGQFLRCITNLEIVRWN